MEYKDILTDLNEAQNAAVTTDALCPYPSGAGSGKTKVSYTGWPGTYKWPKPDHGILAVTFTNKAAEK